MARLALLFVGAVGTILATAGCREFTAAGPEIGERVRDWNSAQLRPLYDWLAGAKVGERFRDCAQCPEMVVVPAGEFLMGSPESEAGRFVNEGPVHRVRIAAPFAVGVYEVTFAEWDACMEDGGCDQIRIWHIHDEEPGWQPVDNIRWNDAQEYVEWLTAKTGERYRLPSESEWEYAARAGTRTSRPWGDSESGQCRHANGADAESKRRLVVRVVVDGHANDVDAERKRWLSDYVENFPVASCDDGRATWAPVGRFKANAWGLHDVLGNLWEWTEDCWNDSYAGAPTDGSAWRSGDCSRSVLRGGSWLNPPRGLRSAERNREHISSDSDRSDVGFRVARTLTLAEAHLGALPGQPFTVVVEPSSAEVRIPGIASPYRAGMRLPAGNYRVEASAEGHQTAMETVAHGSSPTSHRMALRKLVAGRFRDCVWCPEMVVVPAGEFLMGSRVPEDERDRYSYPGPVRRVRIAAPFAVGVYEVTFSEWDACEEDGGCRGYSPHDHGQGRGRRPVTNVSWTDAQAYVRWLSEKTGKRYRLPSESEWEYAARAGARTLQPWGENESEQCRHANGRSVSMCETGTRTRLRSGASRRMPGACMMSWVTSGNGRRTVGMTAMRVRRRMAAHGKAATALTMFRAGVLTRATISSGLSVVGHPTGRSARYAPTKTGVTAAGSVWSGRSPRDFSC